MALKLLTMVGDGIGVSTMATQHGETDGYKTERKRKKVLGFGQNQALKTASRLRVTARDDLEQLTYVPVTGD